MVCGQHEAVIRQYHKYPCKNDAGIWLVAAQENAAENVYFHSPADINSQGFGGATLKFPLVDGSIYEAKGPWHGNADSLFKDTGIDVRNTHFTFVVLSMGRRCAKAYETVMTEVIYQDEKAMIGCYDRWKTIAKQYPQALMYYSESSGGSCSGPISAKDRE